jgi:hypothetical protein
MNPAFVALASSAESTKSTRMGTLYSPFSFLRLNEMIDVMVVEILSSQITSSRFDFEDALFDGQE